MNAARLCVTALVLALCACAADSDELDEESAAILKRVPAGTAFVEVPAAMRELGFTCTPGRWQYTDKKGQLRSGEPHLTCERDEERWVVCKRRTRAILLERSRRLSNILVNVGYFCV